MLTQIPYMTYTRDRSGIETGTFPKNGHSKSLVRHFSNRKVLKSLYNGKTLITADNEVVRLTKEFTFRTSSLLSAMLFVMEVLIILEEIKTSCH